MGRDVSMLPVFRKIQMVGVDDNELKLIDMSWRYGIPTKNGVRECRDCHLDGVERKIQPKKFHFGGSLVGVAMIAGD